MLVVPGTTAILFPAMDSKLMMPALAFTRTPVLSAKIMLEKSTILMRDKETEVDPHSISAEPSMIVSNRERVSTSTHLIARDGSASSRSMNLLMRSQSSMV
jgi:hypothetical protein